MKSFNKLEKPLSMHDDFKPNRYSIFQKMLDLFL